MAYKAKLYKNGDVIDYTPTAAVAAGDVIIAGSICGVAHRPIAANVEGTLLYKGIFDMETASATTFSVGDKVYWNTTSKQATATTTDTLIGVAVKACVSGDTTVRVLLGTVDISTASASE